MVYTSVTNNKIKEIKKLNQKKYRDETNKFLIEGLHLIIEANKAGYLKEIIALENENININIKTTYVSEKVMSYLSELTHPPKIMGICEKKQNKLKEGHILILDEIQDPGNLGTIIRSSVAFNIDTIILGQGCADIYSQKVIRASQGMIFHTNFIKENLSQTITKLKQSGHKILGTKVTGGKELKTIEKNKKFAIIMGNEGSGVKKEYLEKCDEYIYIEMNKNCESLNVAIATSIILYELR